MAMDGRTWTERIRLRIRMDPEISNSRFSPDENESYLAISEQSVVGREECKWSWMGGFSVLRGRGSCKSAVDKQSATSRAAQRWS
jgi:hypothetical protein